MGLPFCWSEGGGAHDAPRRPYVVLSEVEAMRRITRRTVAAAILAGVVACWAGSAAAADLTITGPGEPVDPGELVQLTIEDLAVAKLPTARVIHFPRRRVVVFAAQLWGGTPVVFFQAKIPGEYLVAVTAGEDYGEIVIEVGGEDPDPDPDPKPDPDPDPVPPGPRFVLMISETETITAQQANVIEDVGIYCDEAGHDWRSKDPDTVEGATGKTPAWLKWYLDEMKRQDFIPGGKLGGPVIVVATPPDASGRGKLLTMEWMPDTTEEAIALIKKYGG